MSAVGLVARHLGAGEPILAEAGDDKDRVVVTPIRVLVARSGRIMGQRSQSLMLDCIATLDVTEKDGVIETLNIGALGGALSSAGSGHQLQLSDIDNLAVIKDAIAAALLSRRHRGGMGQQSD